MQHVGDQQLLVLLFVLEAKRDQVGDGCVGDGCGRIGEERDHGGIDMRAIAGDFRDGRAGQQAAPGPWVAGADCFVIGVEKEGEIAVEHPVAGGVRDQNELFEEPGGVRAMPFRGARIGHGLHALIFGTELRGQALGMVADGAVAVGQRRDRDVVHARSPP